MRVALATLALSLVVPVASARVLDSGGSFLTYPDIHGDRVVFTCEGDLWLGNATTGEAHRLTSDPGIEDFARFSPDGRTIAFTADYDGSSGAVYVMPVEGGTPKRLTFDGGSARVQGWTPDGTAVMYASRARTAVGFTRRLFTVPAKGGLSTLLPVPRGEHGAMGPDGRLAYVPVSAEWMNWFHYHGGAADDIWITQPGKGTFRRLTTSTGVDTTPVWVGDQILYAGDTGTQLNLCRLDPASGKSTPITKYTDAPVRYPGSDGKRVVFQHGPGLAMYDSTVKGDASVRELRFALDSDRIHARAMRVPLTTAVTSALPGPGGKRVAIEARGQIVTVAAKEGDLRILAGKPGTRNWLGAWSPDGKRIAYISDESGEQQIWTVDAAGGAAPVKLTTTMSGELNPPKWSPDGATLVLGDRQNDFWLIDAKTGASRKVAHAVVTGSYDDRNTSYTFSPDGKWVALSYYDDPTWSSVKLIEVATGKATVVSPEGVNCTAPSFDPTGKFLVYLADRDLQPGLTPVSMRFTFNRMTRVSLVPLAKETDSPFLPQIDDEGDAKPPETKTAAGLPVVKVDLDGLRERTIDVPAPSANYMAVTALDGKLLLQSMDNPYTIEPGGPATDVMLFDFTKKAMTPVASGVGGATLTPSGKHILLQTGPMLALAELGGPVNMAEARIKTETYALQVEPEAEWRQIFEESWRLARDFFYDPNMHGLDWDAIGRKYRAQLPMVGSREDLTALTAAMISELNIGHAYVGFRSAPPRNPVNVGYLGADLDPVPGQPAAKVAKILRSDSFDLGLRSPLSAPGVNVKEGDYIVAIAGEPLRADEDPQARLLGTAGQIVAISVNDRPTMTGARTVRVRTLASDSQLRYEDWVVGRQAYVREHAGPNFAYLHMPDMVGAGLVGFSKGFFPNLEKDAIIVDTRFNGGGFVSMLVLENLMAKRTGTFAFRQGGSFSRESWAPTGYSAVIINEDNFSDGEFFPYMYHKAELGPIVGKRTGGGEVGSGGGYAMIDGGVLYIPNYGAWMDGKWIIEGNGAEPDVEVDQDPAAVLAGRDPQLDKTIALLQAKLAAKPIVRPKHPPFPVKTVGTKGG